MKQINLILFSFLLLIFACGKHLNADPYAINIKDTLSGVNVEVYEGILQRGNNTDISDIIIFNNRTLNIEAKTEGYDLAVDGMNEGDKKSVYFKGKMTKRGPKEYIDLVILMPVP